MKDEICHTNKDEKNSGMRDWNGYAQQNYINRFC